MNNMMWCPTNLLMLVPEDSQHMADMLMEYRQAYSHLQFQYAQMKLQYEQLQNEYTRYVKSVNAAEELCSDWRQSSCAAKCKRIIKRRKEDELNKCFKCPYPNCKKDYASTLALSLHIKNKHNGGSKRDRDRAAKLLIQSQLAGTASPELGIQLPPDYVEANKQRLLLPSQVHQLSSNIQHSSE